MYRKKIEKNQKEPFDMIWRDLPAKARINNFSGVGFGRPAAHPCTNSPKGIRHTGGFRIDTRYLNCQKHKSWA